MSERIKEEITNCDSCGKELPKNGLHFTNTEGDFMQECPQCGQIVVLKKSVFIVEIKE